MLTPTERQILLAGARNTLRNAIMGTPQVDVQNLPPALFRPSGAFVTLYKGNALRGCVGFIEADRPLYETVCEVAVRAALDDPRFEPVEAEEIPELVISVSVLSPIRKITSVDEIEVGTHGIVLQSPLGRGLLLPKVAVRYGWNRARFLEETAQKAGLPPGGWADPGVIISVFTAEEFSEQEVPHGKQTG